MQLADQIAQKMNRNQHNVNDEAIIILMIARSSYDSPVVINVTFAKLMDD